MADRVSMPHAGLGAIGVALAVALAGCADQSPGGGTDGRADSQAADAGNEVPGAGGDAARDAALDPAVDLVVEAVLDAADAPSEATVEPAVDALIDAVVDSSADLAVDAPAPSLTALSLSAGVLSPGFAPVTTTYGVDLDLAVQSLTVTPTAPGDTITVNGSIVASGAASPPITLNLGANVITVIVSGAGGSRTYTITATRGGSVDYIKASNSGAGDLFGSSVALSGDTLAIGAPYEDSSTMGINSTPNEGATDSGAVYVFVRSGTTWSQQAYIKAANTGANDLFGWSVALSGDTLAVGAWGEASSTTGIDSIPNEGASASGAVYVFVRSGMTWSQQAYIKAANTSANDLFGFGVALSVDTLAVGVHGEDSSTMGVDSTPNEAALDSGAVYVFTRSGSTWSQQAYIKAANTGAGDQFGFSVALSGDTLAVGAPYEDSSTTGINTIPNEGSGGSGAAYVFTRSGSTWSQQAYVKASNTGGSDNFGWTTALSGDTLAVGAPGEDSTTTGVNSTPDDSAAQSGAAYVFTRSGSTWSQQAYVKASNTGAGDDFGAAVALSGDTLAVGAYNENSSTVGINSTPDEGALYSGAVYILTRSGTTWSQKGYVKASNTGASDLFGLSVALSGETLAVGAPYEDSSTVGINSAPNEGASASGAAYVY